MAQAKLEDEPKNLSDDGPNPDDLHIGQRLKQRRTSCGISQEKLGQSLGISFQQVQKYESGKNRIPSSRLNEIAKILDAAIDWFLEGIPSGPAPRLGFADNKQLRLDDMPNTNQTWTREQQELVDAYQKISDPKQRRMVFELMKSMAEERDE